MHGELDFARTLNVLLLVTLVSLIVERALALFFESRSLIDRLGNGRKEIICAAVGIGVCLYWKIDAMQVVAPANPHYS